MKNEIIKLLKELLKYKTIKGETQEFKNIFEFIKNNINSNLYYKEYNFNNNIACVISNTNTKNLDIIFSTHIDIVPANNYDFHEDKENIYGRGTIDMKGSVAVLIKIMNTLKTNKKVALFITSDEEIDGNCTYELLKIYTSKLAIVPDGGTNFNLIKEEKGLYRLKLSIKTQSAHSSQPFNGDNAITKLMDIYNEIITKYPLPKNENEYITSINLSRLIGGNADNQVPDNAEMILDIRHTSSDSKSDILKFISSLNKNLEIEELLKGAVFKTDLTNPEIQHYIKTCENILKRKINIIGCESTSDAIYFSDLNIPTIIMNPNGYFAHCKNEYVNKESLYTLFKIYKEFIEGDNNE